VVCDANQTFYVASRVDYVANFSFYDALHTFYDANFGFSVANQTFYDANRVIYGANFSFFSANKTFYGANRVVYDANFSFFDANQTFFDAKRFDKLLIIKDFYETTPDLPLGRNRLFLGKEGSRTRTVEVFGLTKISGEA